MDTLNKYMSEVSPTVQDPPPQQIIPIEGAKSARVLVVDDHPLTRKLIASMLAKAFPSVVLDTAENGESAVAKADSTRYDLILMDIAMPKMDGCRAAQLVRAGEALHGQSPAIIVAITAAGTPAATTSDAASFRDAGFNELVHKPVNNAKLLAIFEKYIYKRNSGLSISQSAADFVPVLKYPNEMILNSEILDMLRGLGILDRTVETFEKQSKALIHKARSADPSQLQKRPNIRQCIHALKGISLNSGASMMGRMCDDLEQVVLECDKDAILKGLDMIETGFAQAMKRFKEVQK